MSVQEVHHGELMWGESVPFRALAERLAQSGQNILLVKPTGALSVIIGYHGGRISFGEGFRVGAVALWRSPILMRSSSAAMNQPKSLFLIFVSQSGRIHHRLNPYVCCVLNGDESVE